jgi:hypothetical protein
MEKKKILRRYIHAIQLNQLTDYDMQIIQYAAKEAKLDKEEVDTALIKQLIDNEGWEYSKAKMLVDLFTALNKEKPYSPTPHERMLTIN